MANNNNDYAKGARIGQAYNLAVQEAISKGEIDNLEKIFGYFYKHLQLAAITQKADPEQLATIAKCPKIIKLFDEINNEIQKN